MTFAEMKQAIKNACEELNVNTYEIYYMEEASNSVQALFHDINSFSTEARAGICFRVVVDGKQGQASTEAMSEEEAYRIVEAALQNAKLMESEEEAMIRPLGDTYTEVPAVHTTEPTSAEMINTVLSMQEAAYQKDEHICDGTRTALSYDSMKIALANSEGLDLNYEADFTSFVSGPCATDGTEKYSDYNMKAADFKGFDTEKFISDAVENSVSRIGESSCETGNYTLVFSNAMASTMLGTFFTAFNGEAANQKMSLFRDAEGNVVASDLVSIVDDPFCEESMIRLPFDSEGTATRKKCVIDQGVLKTLLYDMKSAKKAGKESTGNGLKAGYSSAVSVMPTNFIMQAGDAGTKDEIFEKVENGIYITAMNGLHAGANPITGDFSISSAGFMIENGKKGRPVKNFTISGNFYQWLKDISMVGSEVEYSTPRGLSVYGAPVVVVPNMPVAGK